MEKKTLTSLAMITFLMTSTAVIAMGDEEKPATTASALQLKKIEEQIPSTPPKKAWSFFGIFTWGGSDSSTIEASPASMPSSAPAIEHLRENSGPTEEEFLQASMSLTRDQLQELIKDEIIPNPTPALTVPSSDPVESLSTEQVGALRRLWNRFWGTGSATETKVLPGAVIEEDRASVPSSSNLAGSSSQIEPEVRPSVKLNPASFAIVRDDIKGRGLMTPFSFNSPQEGSFKVSGEGTLFYQVLSKPLMDSF
ncbi:MAG: hypothetical protein K2Y08_03750, partial [Alphaproteobacteria bacterium]|nr:hypothetical protein [Alphaproteobacteria bacterium]